MDLPNERWASVPGYEGHYEVSDFGRVRSLKYKRVTLMNPMRNHGDYLVVGLCRKSRKRRAFVHRLVLETFVGPPKPGQHGAHLDRRPGNNNLKNLKWVDPIENIHHSIAHGTFPRGSMKPEAKLTEASVKEIRNLYAQGAYTQKHLGSLFGVTKGAIGFLLSRKTWAHVE